jgi:O-antigen/teichoic acid export membrane protein
MFSRIRTLLTGRSLKVNILASYLTTGWTSLLGLIMVPVYAHMIGMEARGLVGLFASMSVVLALFDMGLGAALNRELARASADEGKKGYRRDLVRTLEWIYWPLAALLAMVFGGIGYFFAADWVNVEKLRPDEVRTAALVLGVQMGLGFPQTLYNGGLYGLERQAIVNVTGAVMNCLRHVGVLLALLTFGSTVTVFVMWQAVISLLNALAGRKLLWAALPAEPGMERPAFDKALLRNIRGFAGGMLATSLVTIPMQMTDRVLLSKWLPLGEFGYYTTAVIAAATISLVTGPFFHAYTPRMSRLMAAGDGAGLRRTFQTGCQILSALVLPACMAAVFFAMPLLRVWLWKQPAHEVEASAPALAFLVAGNACNALMNLPYGLTVAAGWSKFGFWQNLIMLCFVMPALFIFAGSHGATGAAAVWLGLNLATLMVSGPIIFRRTLPGAWTEWATHSVLRPLLICLAVFVPARLLASDMERVPAASVAVLASMIAVAACAWVSPEIREAIGERRRRRTATAAGIA